MAIILWIEDEANKIGGLVKPIIKDGHTIIVAKDRVEAIEKLNKQVKIDLVLLDLIIPSGQDQLIDQIDDYEGVNVLTDIKDKLGPNIPIIVLTVVDDADLFIKLEQLGVKKILRKGSLLPSVLKNEIYKTLDILK
jgi:CheY-like chemotaxis protein